MIDNNTFQIIYRQKYIVSYIDIFIYLCIVYILGSASLQPVAPWVGDTLLEY